MDCSMPGLPVHRQLPKFTQLMSVELVMPSNHRLRSLNYYMMSTLPQTQLCSLITQNNGISSTCQQVPSEIHRQSVFRYISLLPSSSAGGPQTSGTSTPGSALTSREKELQTVFQEILIILLFMSSVSFLGGPPTTLRFLSSLRHFALKPYGR